MMFFRTARRSPDAAFIREIEGTRICVDDRSRRFRAQQRPCAGTDEGRIAAGFDRSNRRTGVVTSGRDHRRLAQFGKQRSDDTAGFDYRLQDVSRKAELLEHRPGPITCLCVEHLRGGRIRVFAGDADP